MIDARKYWDSRYSQGSNSGNGSYGDELFDKLLLLGNLNGVKTISEIGCGDFNLGKNLLKYYPNAKYTGQDISDVIVERNKIDYPENTFTTNLDELPSADLLLCIDVLFHILDEKEVILLLNQIEKRWHKYLAITAYERDQEMHPESHVRIRKFAYQYFGEPIIRRVVEEDGEKYFYLFKRASVGPEREMIDFNNVTACLITKESEYPKEIQEELKKYPFKETLVILNSDSPFNKYKLFSQVKTDYIYYQDDDAIAPVEQLRFMSCPDTINVVMKPEHYEGYKDTRMTMGLGWGAIFPKTILISLKKYIDKYGMDEVFKRDTERILTYLNYPQNRLVLPVKDLPSAWSADRLWRQPEHFPNIQIVEERCRKLVL